MFKYRVRFKLDIEDALEYDDSEQYAEITEIDDECFDKTFDTDEKIKEFENWYNDGYDSSSEKINVKNIVYDRQDEDTGILEVTLNDKLKDEKTFADELVTYLFEGDYPTVRYHVTGTTYEDYWDYHRDSPEQRTVNVDYEDSTNVHSFSNVEIEEIH